MKLNCPNIGAPTSEIHEILDRILNELDVSGPWGARAFKSVIINGILNEIELSDTVPTVRKCHLRTTLLFVYKAAGLGRTTH